MMIVPSMVGFGWETISSIYGPLISSQELSSPDLLHVLEEDVFFMVTEPFLPVKDASHSLFTSNFSFQFIFS